jgi:hypothetical protein
MYWIGSVMYDSENHMQQQGKAQIADVSDTVMYPLSIVISSAILSLFLFVLSDCVKYQRLNEVPGLYFRRPSINSLE